MLGGGEAPRPPTGHMSVHEQGVRESEREWDEDCDRDRDRENRHVHRT